MRAECYNLKLEYFPKISCSDAWPDQELWCDTEGCVLIAGPSFHYFLATM